MLANHQQYVGDYASNWTVFRQQNVDVFRQCDFWCASTAMWRYLIFFHFASGLVWIAHATIVRIFLIVDASVFSLRCVPVNKYSTEKVPLASIAGDFTIDLLPAGDCYFHSGPDTFVFTLFNFCHILPY
jgi:hypothetical protein